MGKLLLAAFFGGVLGAILTLLVSSSLAGRDREAAIDARLDEAESRIQSAETKATVATSRADSLMKRVDGQARDTAKAILEVRQEIVARPAGDGEPGAAPATAAVAPDGTPWVSRGDLDRAIAAARGAGGLTVEVGKDRKAEQKAFEDIARELGLSSAEEANVRDILRQSEEEMVRSLFGDRPYSEIAAEVREAKDDPEKMEALVSQTVGNAIANIGKLATLEGRTRKKVDNVLGKERSADLLRRPRKPVLGEEFERLFEGLDMK